MIKSLLKSKSVCFVMEIRYCKGSLSKAPNSAAQINDVVAISYQVFKVQTISTPG